MRPLAGALCVVLLGACDDEPRRTAPAALRPSKVDPPPPGELMARAREALDAGQWGAAHNGLMMVEVLDVDGGYSEERLLLQVRALMALTPNEVAEVKADEFHRAFPESPLGPQVEAALLPLYRLEPGRAKARERKVKALITRELNERRRRGR